MFAGVATTVCINSSSSWTAAIVVTAFQNKRFLSVPSHLAAPTGRRLVGPSEWEWPLVSFSEKQFQTIIPAKTELGAIRWWSQTIKQPDNHQLTFLAGEIIHVLLYTIV